MKYKLLLVGSNDTVVDQFFIHMENKFETQYCSQRVEDIVNHVKYFQPDMFICCIAQENSAFYNHMLAAKMELDKEGIPMGIIGSRDVCDDFIKGNANLVDLCLYRPISNAAIEEKIKSFLKKRKAVNEKQQENKEKTEEIGDMDLELLELEKLQKELEAEIEKPVRRKHVLVVYDDPIMLKLIKGYLQENYDVAVAINGKVALKFLDKNSTDLVLLDYEMPEEKGPDVLAKIRNNPLISNLPVVFLTGVNSRELVEGCLKLGPDGYLLKPVDKNLLIKKVKEVIG